MRNYEGFTRLTKCSDENSAPTNSQHERISYRSIRRRVCSAGWQIRQVDAWQENALAPAEDTGTRSASSTCRATYGVGQYRARNLQQRALEQRKTSASEEIGFPKYEAAARIKARLREATTPREKGSASWML